MLSVIGGRIVPPMPQVLTMSFSVDGLTQQQRDILVAETNGSAARQGATLAELSLENSHTLELKPPFGQPPDD
jgi:hypothetical protein